MIVTRMHGELEVVLYCADRWLSTPYWDSRKRIAYGNLQHALTESEWADCPCVVVVPCESRRPILHVKLWRGNIQVAT